MKKITIILTILFVSVSVFSQIVETENGMKPVLGMSGYQKKSQNIEWGRLINIPDSITDILDSTVYINVIDYGADNTKATNTTTQIQAACNVMTDNSSLFFPPGDYLVSGDITIDSLSNFGIIFAEGAKLYWGSDDAFTIKSYSISDYEVDIDSSDFILIDGDEIQENNYKIAIEDS